MQDRADYHEFILAFVICLFITEIWFIIYLGIFLPNKNDETFFLYINN